MTLAYGFTVHRTPEPFDTADILAEAIREHLVDRRWYRSQPHPAVYADLARENDIALRALVAVARRARRLARAELVPLDTRGWAPGELTEAYGR
jgi:hypothetical protein